MYAYNKHGEFCRWEPSRGWVPAGMGNRRDRVFLAALRVLQAKGVPFGAAHDRALSIAWRAVPL